MGKILDLERFGESTAVIDEYGGLMTYDALNFEACALAEKI